jgi:hypothetical protein
MEEAKSDPTRRPMRLEGLFLRLDHLSAWISAAVLFLYVLSGYGLTRPDSVARWTGGLMTQDLAYTLHNNLYIPLVIFFVLHTGMSLRRALFRATRRKAVSGWTAVGVGVLALAYLVLLGWA